MKGLVLAVWLAPAFAHAAGLVAVTDQRVTQYRQAIGGARDVLGGIPVVDASAGDAADQLRRADAAVVLAVGQKALALAKSALPDRPTVFCMVLGAASSRTVSGVKLEVPPAQQLSQLKQVAPSARRIGVIYDPRTSGAFMEEAVKAAGREGLTLVSRPVSDAKEVRGALADIAGGIDALWLMSDPRLINAEMFNFLLVTTLEHRIALFGFLDSFTEAGALASVAPDYTEIGRRAARMAQDLMQKPADQRLPMPPPVGSPGALSVNLKTARRLGLDISPSALSKARQVYR